MEASVAAQGDGADTGQEQGQEQQSSGLDANQLLDQLRPMLDERFQEFDRSMQDRLAPAEGAEAETDWLEGFDPAAPEFDPQAFQQTIADQIKQAAAEAAAPAQQAVQELRREQAVADLVGEYPELGDEQTGTAVVQAAGQLAQQIGQESGLPADVVQQLANSPAMWRMVYRSAKAGDAAAQETPADGGQTYLEGGSGPGPVAGEQDPTDRIFGGARGADVLL